MNLLSTYDLQVDRDLRNLRLGIFIATSGKKKNPMI